MSAPFSSLALCLSWRCLMLGGCSPPDECYVHIVKQPTGKMSGKAGMQNTITKSKIVIIIPIKSCYQNSSLQLASLDGSSQEKNKTLKIPIH